MSIVVNLAHAELAALSTEAKTAVHLILGEVGLAREHALALGQRLEEVFNGPVAAPDTSEADGLRQQLAALSGQLATAGTDLDILKGQLAAAQGDRDVFRDRIAALEAEKTAAAEEPAPQPETSAAPAPQPAEANVPQDPLQPQ